MALLVFSNHGDWDSDSIGFVGMISTETVIQYGYINAIQTFIRDTDVLPGIFEDEHKGLSIRTIDDTDSEFYDVMQEQGLTLWADCGQEPRFFVEVLTPTDYWIFVLFVVP